MMPLLLLFVCVVGAFLLAAYILQKFLYQDNTSGPDDHYFKVEEKMADSDGA